jgi:tetratricopeptide (TPR) repeat protein
VCLLSTTAWSQDDIEFYNRGLKSSLAYKKIEYFSKAIQANPNMAEAYEKRAIHFYFQRRFDKAIQDYTKVIELKPHSVDAYLMLGRAYLRKKKGSGIKGEIKNLALNLRKHQIGEYNQSLERAIENFSRAIELDPQLASAYSYRADAYRIKGILGCGEIGAVWPEPMQLGPRYTGSWAKLIFQNRIFVNLLNWTPICQTFLHYMCRSCIPASAIHPVRSPSVVWDSSVSLF